MGVIVMNFDEPSCLSGFLYKGLEVKIGFNSTSSDFERLYTSMVTMVANRVLPSEYVFIRIGSLWYSRLHIVRMPRGVDEAQIILKAYQDVTNHLHVKALVKANNREIDIFDIF